jgi:hypothetical protein
MTADEDAALACQARIALYAKNDKPIGLPPCGYSR